jgi:hypothetical protein
VYESYLLVRVSQKETNTTGVALLFFFFSFLFFGFFPHQMYHLIRILAFEAFVPRCFDFENIKSCILASGNIELRLERQKKKKNRKKVKEN